MRIQAIVGGNTVEASGSVVLDNSEAALTITIDNISYCLAFFRDGGAPRTEFEPDGPLSLRLKLYNWDNSLGMAQSFNNIGTISGQNVHLRLYVHAIGDMAAPVRLVSYTVLSGVIL